MCNGGGRNAIGFRGGRSLISVEDLRNIPSRCSPFLSSKQNSFMEPGNAIAAGQALMDRYHRCYGWSLLFEAARGVQDTVDSTYFPRELA